MLYLLIGVVALVVCCGLQLISVQVGVVLGTILLASYLSRWLSSRNTTGLPKEWEGPLIKLYRSAEEHPEPLEGTLIGTIPDWLCGRFFRCGPAKYEVGDTRFSHWFDGLAMLMSFDIRNGTATFQSKFLRSRVYQKCIAANRIVVSGMGTAAHPDPCKTIFQRVMSHFKQLNPASDYDNTWVTTYPMGEDYIVASETDVINSFDPVTLDIKERIRHSKYMAVNGATAHAHYDPDGTVYNMGGSFKGRPQYNIIEIPPADKTSGDDSPLSRGKVVCSIPARHKTRPAYFHSFAMTDNYYVFVEMPYYVHVVTMMWNASRGKPFIDALKFHPDEQAWFYLVRREDGEILKTRYVTDGFTFFHVINAYEEKDSVVFDLCGYDSADYTAVTMERIVQGSKEDLSTVRRFVLPLQETKMQTGENLVQLEYTTATAVVQEDGSIYCSHEILTNGMDLPQINYAKYRGKKYRYAYGICDFNFVSGEKLVKLDVTTKDKLIWSEKDCFPSEPVFVAAPDAQEEDEGVLVSAVISSDEEKAPFLLVMDAATMKELGRVVFDKVAFPRGAHGLFTNKS